MIDDSLYQIGDRPKLVARFQDPISGAYVQPAAVTLQILDPTGAVRTVTPTWDPALATPDHVVAGGFFSYVDAEIQGKWAYRFASAVGDPYQAAAWNTFMVESSPFTP